MDQRTAHPHRLFRLCAVAALLALLTACGGGGKAVVAPVEELSERSRSRPPVVRATTQHRVQPGETLYAIAFLHGLDFQQVARWNGIRAPYVIHVGQWLRLTPPKQLAQAPPPKPKAAKKAPAQEPQAKKRPAKPAKKTPPPKVAQAKPAPKPKPKAVKPRGPVKVRWGWPTQGKLLSTFSSRKPGRKGIDIGGKRGQPVVAAAAGEVVYSGNGLQRYYGKLIIIKHNDRFLSAYAHNDRLRVKEGAWVKAGQRIADLGSSGTDRVKLHFEIRRDGKPVNPTRYLPKR